MKKETYGNPFRSGEKNIDDLYKSLIQELAKNSREEQKFQYVMKDIFEMMRELEWDGDSNIEVNFGGVAVSGIQQLETSNPKWSKPYGTVTKQPDAFIVIKNRNNTISSTPSLPQGTQKPVVI